jgi:L-ascorbate metabolism protein UlaG (beta-lactamase superfamily)
MKKAAVIVGITATAALGCVAAERFLVASPHYRGQVSDHFDGSHFYNQGPVGRHLQGSFLKWMMNRDQGPWREWVEAPYGPPPPRRVSGGRLHVTFINHATTLIQMDGVNILTDPTWSERASPFGFMGPRRHRPPGIRFADLPPIDVVLVSHNHYDHLDIPTLWRLRVRHAPRIYTPLGNSLLMARNGLTDAHELDWWQSVPIGNGVTLTLVPAQHFCARAFSDRNATLWGGFVVSGPSGSVYFAGDTGWGHHFEQIASRFPHLRLALLPIGAFRPRWFMKPVHISPEEAVHAHVALGAQTTIPIHYGTFHLGDDGETEPVEELRRAIAVNGNPNVQVLGFGEGRDIE